MIAWKSKRKIIFDVGTLTVADDLIIDFGAVVEGEPPRWVGTVFCPDIPEVALKNDPATTGYTTQRLFDAPPVNIKPIKRLLESSDTLVLYNSAYVLRVLDNNNIHLPEATCVIDLLPWVHFFQAAPDAGHLKLASQAPGVVASQKLECVSLKHAIAISKLMRTYMASMPDDVGELLERQAIYELSLRQLISKSHR